MEQVGSGGERRGVTYVFIHISFDNLILTFLLIKKPNIQLATLK